MTIRTLLIGPRGHGGEGVYVSGLYAHAPDGVSYDLSGDFHASAAGATCAMPVEVALNKLVRPRTFPDIGMRALWLRQPYDLVHVHAHPVWLHGLGDTPLVMSEGSSAAVYLADYLGWEDGMLDRAFKRSRKIFRALKVNDRLLGLERVTKLYVFSEWARQINLRWGADPEKLEVIYPGFDTPPPRAEVSHEQFTFLFIGSDFERKGGYDVVDAFDRIASDIPNSRLVIVGSDAGRPNPDLLIHSWASPQRRERALAKLEALEQRGQATRMPWITEQRLRTEVFPAADAVLMPTYAEGFGFTNVEAMSFGLPVITSRTGPADEIVTADRTGLLIDAGDVAQLASAMARLATKPEEAASMGAAGRLRFEQRFTRQRFREDLGGLYRRALEQR
jgi:glycosyltransferase involved in cell wall biosynthesis